MHILTLAFIIVTVSCFVGVAAEVLIQRKEARDRQHLRRYLRPLETYNDDLK